MFFDLVLFSKQHKGRFGQAWIAGTRGVQYMNKRDLLALDVKNLCEEIAGYICSESDSPRQRFSLRLSAILVDGTLRIYSEQVKDFFAEIFRILTIISKPVGVSLPSQRTQLSSYGTPPSPVVKRKRSKKVVSSKKSTPESELEAILSAIKSKETLTVPEENLEEQTILQARVDEVTIRETQKTDKTAFEEEFGALGPALTEEELFRLMEPRPSTSILAPIAEEGVSHVPVPAPVQSSSSEEQVGVVVKVQAQVHAPAELEELEVHRATVEPTAVEKLSQPLKVGEEEALPRAVLQEIQSVEKIKRKRPVKSKEDSLSKVLVSYKSPKVIRINRIEYHQVQWVDKFPSSEFYEIKLKPPNLTNLLSLYLVGTEVDSMKRDKSAEDLEVSAGLRHLRKSGQITPPASVSVEREPTQPIPQIRISEEQPIETPLAESSSLEMPQPVLASTPKAMRTLEKSPFLAEESEQLESPRKRRRLIEPITPEPPEDFLTIPTDSREPTAPGIPSIEEELVQTFNERDRQQFIVNQVSIRGQLTLEDVCLKPINRLNIARAFNDVLVLSKYKYVTLISEENSSELKFIQKGPKMN